VSIDFASPRENARRRDPEPSPAIRPEKTIALSGLIVIIGDDKRWMKHDLA